MKKIFIVISICILCGSCGKKGKPEYNSLGQYNKSIYIV